MGEGIRNGFPARYLEPGDIVQIEVEGIGVLRYTIAPKMNPLLAPIFLGARNLRCERFLIICV